MPAFGGEPEQAKRFYFCGLDATETAEVAAGLRARLGMVRVERADTLVAATSAGVTAWRLPPGMTVSQASDLIVERAHISLFCIAVAPLSAALCLLSGAADAVNVPYDTEEAVARLSRLAVARGGASPARNLSLPRLARWLEVRRAGQASAGNSAGIRSAELKILAYLSRHRPHFVPTQELQTRALQSTGDGTAVRFHVREIRRTLGASVIESRRGLGYRLTIGLD